MTLATKLEVKLTDIICAKDFPFNRFLKIGGWIANRQADREEAARLGVSVNNYKQELKGIITKTKTF